jgi:hypothetical protein
MNYKPIMLAVVAGLTLSVTAAADTLVITEPQVRTIVTDAGYRDPIVIKQEGELWRVVSVDKDSDDNVTLFVNAKGEVLGAAAVTKTLITQPTASTTTVVVDPANPMTESSVATIVMNSGFHNVHDIDYLDGKGVWKAEADDITGEDYELHVNPTSGRIVHVEDD